MRTAVVMLAIVMAAMILVAGCTKANATVAPMNSASEPVLTNHPDGGHCLAEYPNGTVLKCTPTQEIDERMS